MTRILAAFPNLTGVPHRETGYHPTDGWLDPGVPGVFEPVIAIAASPRDWANRLHHHVVDHGGVRVRATVLHPADALDQSFDVLVVDDTTSFLTRPLVTALHDQGRCVLGVYEDLRGERHLVDLGVDQAVERTMSTAKLLTAVGTLATSARAIRQHPHSPGQRSHKE
jgi:hypothetical protein